MVLEVPEDRVCGMLRRPKRLRKQHADCPCIVWQLAYLMPPAAEELATAVTGDPYLYGVTPEPRQILNRSQGVPSFGRMEAQLMILMGVERERRWISMFLARDLGKLSGLASSPWPATGRRLVQSLSSL